MHEKQIAAATNDNELANESNYGRDNYYYRYGKRRRRVDNDELVRSGKFRVSGWNADGSERLMPVAPDSVAWEAWDAIRQKQGERKRQAEQLDEGRGAKRVRFGDG